MSLVGSLEDLALGDILQIVSLARKSGLLLLRSESGDGRILFRDGLVQAAYMKGEPDDLAGVLIASGMADAEVVSQAVEDADASDRPAAELLSARTGLAPERIDSLRREQVERVVVQMFRWDVGEFSFDVRDEIEPRDQALALSAGINAQFLSMEAARLGDEEDAGAPSQTEDFLFSGEGPDDDDLTQPEVESPLLDEALDDDDITQPAIEPPLLDEAPDDSHDASEASHDDSIADDPPDEPIATDAREFLALVTAAAVQGHEESPAASPADEESEEAAASDVPEEAEAADTLDEAEAVDAPEPEDSVEAAQVPLVVIDSELRALEWIKSVVGDRFQRVHIFQHAEGGIGRIRQYLMRGQPPTALVSINVQADSLSDSGEPTELLRRLRAQAPRMPILVLHQGEEPDEPGVAAANALVARPATAILNDRRRQAEVEEAATSLLLALEPWSRRDGASEVLPDMMATRRASDEASLERLREISDRLRDPATVGDVLTVVMEFAAESFQRVAMFMVRDDEAVGISQRGLQAAGGPDEAGFRSVRVPLDEPACFNEVVASRSPQRLVPDDDGDRQLTGRLGNAHPPEIYVAPIESGGRVAAILYADNLPGPRRLRDPAALTVVLHEAGLALDRALLERALAEAEGADAGA